jgi:hypothetical protein
MHLRAVGTSSSRSQWAASRCDAEYQPSHHGADTEATANESVAEKTSGPPRGRNCFAIAVDHSRRHRRGIRRHAGPEAPVLDFALHNPIRRNTLQERRDRLGLSRVALARILDVDPASIFRHERNRMPALWDYALRGVEAEAAFR